ncbi:MAG: hypothetical protein WAW11_00770 [Patescibacteria group bacterium]
MKKIINLKNLLFLLLVQLASGSIVRADLDTKGMDEQSKALIGSSGLAGAGDLAGILSVTIQVILGFLGIIFLALTLMAGFKWMTSQGNEKTIEEAKGSLKNSIIGLLIVLAAYGITLAVFNYLPFATGGNAEFSGPPSV